MLTNDSLMVPTAHANMAQQSLSVTTDSATNTPSSHKDMKNCHDNVDNLVNNVNNTVTASLPQTGCCDDAGFCSLDCHHCLTISLVANLIDMQLTMSNTPINSTPITMVVNRVSIAFPPAFRPPIA
ncbi:hypothetical protein [Shewanella livingstonensis]|uniref:Uncharacterized protein n=1 Tax=Shewanella livingstonensis TaxID=150120 RepID=A0A3G8M211_9GAMM|nr:hypothetical protein [Shewanella livingstonensis]AZG75040.1 hypothetical protein EGC82_21135 [Shewanella livingstonensis]